MKQVSLLTSARRGRRLLGTVAGGGSNSLSDCDAPAAAPVLPAESYVTWDASKPVRLRMGSEHPTSRPPTTVQAMFRSAAERFPDHPALAVRREKTPTVWTKYTYAQYLDNVINTAKAFKCVI